MFAAADHPDLLVGLAEPDDAAVWRLDDDRALVVTTDFFTPIVDDPYAYGAIAAANALSDVYATGGRPLMALNIAALPGDLPEETLTAIFRGAAETVRHAGAVIAGGHSIRDKEPKFGLVVVGIAHPDKLLTKAAARPGDLLVLTKPLGTGCITTAAKRDRADPAHVDEAVDWMSRLNRSASEAALAAGVRSATDVTGFGLAGHATEIARASRVTLGIDFQRIPLLEGVKQYADASIFPGGSKRNQSAYQPGVHFEAQLSPQEQLLLFDAQTSGGLLLCIPGGHLDRFTAEMTRRDAPWWQIGKVAKAGQSKIVVS